MVRVSVRHLGQHRNSEYGMVWEEEKPNKRKEIEQDTSAFGLQPSRESVLFVPRKCPVCPADPLSNSFGFASGTKRRAQTQSFASGYFPVGWGSST